MTELEKMGARAKDAARILRTVSSEDKELALKEVAGALIRRQSEILEARCRRSRRDATVYAGSSGSLRRTHPRHG